MDKTIVESAVLGKEEAKPSSGLAIFGGILGWLSGVSALFAFLVVLIDRGEINWGNGDGSWMCGFVGLSLMLVLWSIACGVYAKR